MRNRIVPTLIIALAAGSVSAGALDPPAAPTPTQAVVEPRTPVGAETTPGNPSTLFEITASGSYYLTGPVMGQTARHGITVSAANVTIDLNGFTMEGGIATLNAIQSDLDGLTVLNGTVRDWSQSGIRAQGREFRAERVDSVSNLGNGFLAGDGAILITCRAVLNGSEGFQVGEVAQLINCRSQGSGAEGFLAQSDAVFENCISLENDLEGFECGEGALLRGCIARENGNEGFNVGSSSTLEGCSARFNNLEGFQVGNASTLRSCTASANGQEGFNVGNESTLSGCVARNSGFEGFEVGSNSTLTDCTADFNSAGFLLGNSSTVSHCTAAANSPENGFTGNTLIAADHCVAQSNRGNGFSFGSGSFVTECGARDNDENGIRVSSDSVILSSLATGNGGAIADGAGILADGSSNRVDGNHATDNDIGIDLRLGGNIAVRNTARSNTSMNYAFSAGNDLGDIIDLSLVDGEFATGTAWSNFVH